MIRYTVVNVDEKETARHVRTELLRDAGYRVHRRDRCGVRFPVAARPRDFPRAKPAIWSICSALTPKAGSHSWAEFHVGSDG